MDNEIVFEPFYRAIALYLLKESVVDKLDISSEHLVARDISGSEYEFTLLVRRLNQNEG